MISVSRHENSFVHEVELSKQLEFHVCFITHLFRFIDISFFIYFIYHILCPFVDDVFVLQLEGEKTWTIQADGSAEDLNSITSWRTVTMKEGDLLYVPKGIFHCAKTADGFDVSTHVTIGLQESS